MDYKCQHCPCQFASLHDLAVHTARGRCEPRKVETDSARAEDIEQLGWKPFRNGKGEWIFKKFAPSLARMIELRGRVDLNGYEYRISADKFINRRRTGANY